MSHLDNDPELMRRTERQALENSARLSAMMLRRPGLRWLLSPLRRASKWVAAKADEWLKEEGWR